MTIDDLEKLADAAMSPAPYEREQGQADLRAVGMPQTIKQLIALCKMQHEALVRCFSYMTKPPNQRVTQPYSQTADAIKAYEGFNK